MHLIPGWYEQPIENRRKFPVRESKGGEKCQRGRLKHWRQCRRLPCGGTIELGLGDRKSPWCNPRFFECCRRMGDE